MTTEKYVFNFIVDSKFNGKGFNDIDTALKKSEKESEKLNKSLNSLSKVTGINKLQSSFNVLNRRISKLNSTVKDVRTELRKMNDALREVGQKSNVWDRQSTHVKTLKSNVDSLTNSVKEYNVSTQKMSSPKRVIPEGPVSTHHYSHRERNMGRRNPTGEMIETYQPFLMQSPLTGLYGALGLNELKDFTFDLGVKEETNKILMENIGGDYGSFDQITNGQLISMQDLITAMNAQRAIAGLTPEQVNESAPTVAKFGTYAKILTGSDDKANEAMLRLAKGYNGQFAGVDQYGITKESLANTSVGYKKGDSYEKYLAAVDEIMGTQMDKLMGTTQGQISQMQKGFRRAGKEMTNMIMPFVKTFLQIFNQINDVTKGLPSKLIILSGAVLGLTAVLTNAANMVISSYMTIRDITQRGRAWINGPQVTDQNPFDKDFLGKDEKNDYFNQQIASGALQQGKSVSDLIAETKEHYAEQHPLKASFEDAMRSTAQSKKESIRSAPGKIKEQAKSKFKDPMGTADRIRGYFESGPAYDSEKSLRRRNVADLNNLADPTLSLQEKFERIFRKGTAEDVRAGGGEDRFSYDDLSYTTYFKNLKILWDDGISSVKQQVKSFVVDTKNNFKELKISDIVSFGKNKAKGVQSFAMDKFYEGVGRVAVGIQKVEKRINKFIDSTLTKAIETYIRYGKYINAFVSAVDNVTRDIRTTVQTRLRRIRKDVILSINRIRIQVQKHLKTFRTIWANVTDTIHTNLVQFRKKATKAFDGIVQEVAPYISELQDIFNGTSSIMDKLKENWGDTLESLQQSIADSIGPENYEVLSEGFQKLFTKVHSQIGKSTKYIQDKVTPLFSFLNKNWRTTISNLVDTWNKGINKMKDKIMDTSMGDIYSKGKKKVGDISGGFSEKLDDYFGENSIYNSAKKYGSKGKKGISNFLNEEVGKDDEGNSISRKQALGQEFMNMPHGRVMMGGGFALNQMGGMVGGRVGETMEKTGNYMTMAGTGIETAGQIKGFLDKNEQLKKTLFDSAKGFGSLLKKGIGGAMTVLQESFGLSFLASAGVLVAGFIAILAVVKVIQHYWDNIVQTVSNFLNWVKGVAVTIFVEPLIPVFEAIDSVWNAIMGIFGTGGSGDILVDAGNTIIALLQPVGQLIMGVAKVLGFLIKIGLAPLTAILRGIAMGIKGVVDLFRWAVGGIIKVFEPVITAIQKLFEFIAEKAGWLIDALGMGGNGEENPDYDGDGSPDKDTAATSWAKQLVDERDHPEKYQNKPSEDIDTSSLGDLNIEEMNKGNDKPMDLSGSNLEMNTPEVTMQNEEVEQQQPQVEIPQQNIPTSAIQDPAAQNKINNLQKHMASVQSKALAGVPEGAVGTPTDGEFAKEIKEKHGDMISTKMGQMPQKAFGKGTFRDDNAVDKAFDTGLDIAGTIVDAIPGGGIISQGIDAVNRKQEMNRHDTQKADYLHSLGMKSQDEQDTFEDKLWDGTVGNLLGGADHSKYMRQEKREEEFLNQHGFQSQNQKDNIIDKMWDIGAGIYAGVTSLNPWEGIQAVDDSRRGRHNDREHEEYEKGINAYQQIANGQGPTPPPNPQDVPKPQISTPQTQDKDMKNRGTATPITNYLTVNVDNVSDESHIQKMVDAITKVLTFENIKAGRTIGNGDA